MFSFLQLVLFVGRCFIFCGFRFLVRLPSTKVCIEFVHTSSEGFYLFVLRVSLGFYDFLGFRVGFGVWCLFASGFSLFELFGLGH